MKVYKFGGASVSTALGVKRLFNIVKNCEDKLVIVISAMGKTTNHLEAALEKVMEKDTAGANAILDTIEQYHYDIMSALELKTLFIEPVFNKLREFINEDLYADKEYEYRYDYFVSHGEILSTTIVSRYLESMDMVNKLLDMRQIMITDSSYKDANVNIPETANKLLRAVEMGFRVYIVQGFIGGTPEGDTTTLGREGSDYSAAIVANILSSESVTIWKDVDGVYNADPKLFENTVLIPHLSYSDAVELAFNGAQIIHPKTIRPLENKNIALYVKPFNSPEKPGTIIDGNASDIQVPVFILKKSQVLLSIRPKDFSFVLENSLEDIMRTLNKYRYKINLIQSSAVSVSVTTNDSRHFDTLVEELNQNYRVSFNKGLEILTIRGYDDALIDEHSRERRVYIRQLTRRTVRILRDEKA